MQRPTAVTVLGVLNILWGLMGLTRALTTMSLLQQPASSNPMSALMQASPPLLLWTKMALPLGLLSCVLALASGVGLLRLREWGRKLGLVYAVFSLVTGMAGLVISLLFKLQPVLARAYDIKDPAANTMMIAGAVGAVVGGFLSLLYPTLLLIFLMRARIVAAFLPPVLPPALPVDREV